MVGWPRCTYPSIHFFVSRSRSVVDCVHILTFTLELWRSRSVAWQAHIQAFATKTCTRVGLLGPHRKHAGCGHVHPCWRLCLCRRSTAALVWMYITLTFRALRRNHLVSTLFWGHRKKKDLLVTVWEPGQDTQNKDTRDNRHVRQQRDTMWYDELEQDDVEVVTPRPELQHVDTNKTKAQIRAKGTTERASLFVKEKTASVIF